WCARARAAPAAGRGLTAPCQTEDMQKWTLKTVSDAFDAAARCAAAARGGAPRLAHGRRRERDIAAFIRRELDREYGWGAAGRAARARRRLTRGAGGRGTSCSARTLRRMCAPRAPRPGARRALTRRPAQVTHETKKYCQISFGNLSVLIWKSN